MSPNPLPLANTRKSPSRRPRDKRTTSSTRGHRLRPERPIRKSGAASARLSRRATSNHPVRRHRLSGHRDRPLPVAPRRRCHNRRVGNPELAQPRDAKRPSKGAHSSEEETDTGRRDMPVRCSARLAQPVVRRAMASRKAQARLVGCVGIALVTTHPPTRARPGGTVPLQRGLHDARLHLAVRPDDRRFGRGRSPGLVAAYPDRYGKMSLSELCDEMHAEVRALATIELLDRALPSCRCRRRPRPRPTAVSCVPGPSGYPSQRWRVGSLRSWSCPTLPASRSSCPASGPGRSTDRSAYLCALDAFDAEFPGLPTTSTGSSATNTASSRSSSSSTRRGDSPLCSRDNG